MTSKLSDGVLVFGDLKVTLTDKLELRYNDIKSGAKRDGAFWHPVINGDMRPLGTLAVKGYDSMKSNKRVCVLVGDGGGGDTSPVADPIDYEWIWDDRGSGASMDGSIWRPVPPEGYVAVGDVVSRNSMKKPSVKDVWCLRKDLVGLGTYDKDCVWNDQGSGGKYDISAWEVIRDYPSADPDKVIVSPGTFRGLPSYQDPTPPDFFSLAQVLLLPVLRVVQSNASHPVLTSRLSPSDTFPVVESSIVLPCISVLRVHDPRILLLVRSGHPFCALECLGSYSLLEFLDNETDEVQSKEMNWQAGITSEEFNSITTQTTVTVSAEVGAELGKFDARFSVSLEMLFGSTLEITHGKSSSVSRTYQLDAPAGTAVAVWVKNQTFRVNSYDGIIAASLDFNLDNMVISQFPPKGSEEDGLTAASVPFP